MGAIGKSSVGSVRKSSVMEKQCNEKVVQKLGKSSVTFCKSSVGQVMQCKVGKSSVVAQKSFKNE